MSYILIILAALLLTPLLTYRLGKSLPLSTRPSRLYGALAARVFGPTLLSVTLQVLFASVSFDGRCGGWLGEMEPCRFGTFLAEQLKWAYFMNIMPCGLTVCLGLLAFWISRSTRR